MHCWVGGDRTARRETGRWTPRLCCWAGERWATVALLGGRGQTARRESGGELLGGREVDP